MPKLVHVQGSGNNNPMMIALRRAMLEEQQRTAATGQGRPETHQCNACGSCCGGADQFQRGGGEAPQLAAMSPSGRTRRGTGNAGIDQNRMNAHLGEGRQRRGATTNNTGGNVTMQDIQNRQFRGFREVDVNRLREALPRQAQHLAQTFIDAGRRHNLDPLALAAIARHETSNFTSNAFRNKNNAMGVSNARGPIRMSSHERSIDYMAERLASPTGPYRNAQNLRDLWHVYSPPSSQNGGRPVSNDPRDLNRHWGAGVERFIREYERAVGR